MGDRLGIPCVLSIFLNSSIGFNGGDSDFMLRLSDKWPLLGEKSTFGVRIELKSEEKEGHSLPEYVQMAP